MSKPQTLKEFIEEGLKLYEVTGPIWMKQTFRLALQALTPATDVREPHVDCHQCGRALHPRTIICSPCASLASPQPITPSAPFGDSRD